MSRFREKLSPANWVKGVTAISRKISRSWVQKKWGPTCDRDISNSAIYTTAIYRAYTVLLRVASLTLGQSCDCPSVSEVTLNNMGKIYPSHQPHNATDKYPTMHHFVTEMHTFLSPITHDFVSEMCMCAHFCYKVVHCWMWDWCIVGFVR